MAKGRLNSQREKVLILRLYRKIMAKNIKLLESSKSVVTLLQCVEDKYDYGMAIANHLEINTAHIYRMLSRLNKAGLLDYMDEDKIEANSARRPPRRLYMLTERGHKALENGREYFKLLGR